MPVYSRLASLVMVTLAMLALLAAAPGLVAPAAAQDAPGDPSAQRGWPDTLTWTPCAHDPQLECATLAVPVDHDRPRGERFEMAVARATQPGRRIGVVLLLPGGPGESGVDILPLATRLPLVARLRERFDVVSFDPRGIKRSHPVRCGLTPAGRPTSENPAEQATFFDTFSRRVADACLEQNGSFVTSMSTNNIARDVDVLRKALGERQLTIAGGSYGTVTGAVYASLFPERVRAMALDSAILPTFRDGYLEFTMEQVAGFELAFSYLDQLCRSDAACPLHETGVAAAYDMLAARLKAEPVTAPDGTVLDDSGLRNGVAFLLYAERNYPTIVAGLAQALDGNYELLSSIVPVAAQRIKIALDTAVFDAYDVISCNDWGTRRSAVEILPVDRAFMALQPRFAFGDFYLAGETARCIAWTAADLPIIRNLKGRLEVPVLLLGSQFDPATPLSWTRSLARELGMERHLVRYLGGSHVPSNDVIPCIDEVGARYLIERKLPPEGYSCPAQPVDWTP